MPGKPNPNQARVSMLSAWFRSGEWSPSAYLRFCLSQIESQNAEINAVLEVFGDEARKAAAESTRRYKAGSPLSAIDGVPIGVKANIAVAGYACHGGIKAYETTIAAQDAQVIKNLRAAGAIILCSLNMEEGALGAATDNPWYGKTQNPLKVGYTPGGSSGGSAAAVAAGMVPAALGTDTMGSVRIPSAYCGLIGLKPSQALVSIEGVMPLSTTLDHVGPHVRSIADAALLLPFMAGTAQSFDLKARPDARFAAMHIPDDMDIEPEVRARFEQVIESLSKGKHFTQTPDVLGGYNFGAMRRAGLLVSEVEGADYHTPQYEADASGFSAHFQNLLTWGARQPLAKVTKAYDLLKTAESLADDIFAKADVILAPTAPQEAFAFGAPIPAGQADFTAFANFAGLPAVSIPMGKGANGLPLGLQIVGARGQDEYVLQVAANIQRDLVSRR